MDGGKWSAFVKKAYTNGFYRTSQSTDIKGSECVTFREEIITNSYYPSPPTNIQGGEKYIAITNIALKSPLNSFISREVSDVHLLYISVEEATSNSGY